MLSLEKRTAIRSCRIRKCAFHLCSLGVYDAATLLASASVINIYVINVGEKYFKTRFFIAKIKENVCKRDKNVTIYFYLLLT